MRGKRGRAVLANKHFEAWLKAVDVSVWREKPGRAAAVRKAPAKKAA